MESLMKVLSMSIGRIVTFCFVLSFSLIGTGAAAADGEDGEPTIGYEEGFFVSSADERFELKLNATIQPRFSFESVERAEAASEPVEGPAGPVSSTSDASDREHSFAFQIPRAQIKLGGHAWSKGVRYFFQTEFGRGMPLLKDGWIDFALVDGALHLKVGQYKRPFSRQWLTSASTLELVERSITHGFFDPGRDLGLMFHNRFLKSPRVEWALGFFNGHGYVPWLVGDVTVDPDTGEGQITSGRFTNIPDRFNPTIVARLGYNHNRIKGYSEADLEGGGFRFALAASGLFELDADNSGDGNVRAEADYVVKLHGFSTSGAFYLATRSPGDFAEQELDAVGFHVQAGHVFADFVQPVVRYALIDPVGDDDRIQRLLGGLALYFFGHSLKWQVDGGAILRQDPLVGDLTDYTVRTQVQLAF
jgi:hypothetical protein